MVDRTVRPTKHSKRMGKLLKYLMFIFVAIFVASCGGDEKDEPDSPSEPNKSDVISYEGAFPGMSTIRMGDTNFCSLTFGNFNDKSNSDYLNPNTSWTDGAFMVGKASWDFGDNLKVIYFGEVSSLNQIKKLPTATDVNTWNVGKKLFANGGYIIEGTLNGKLYYVRLYITKVTTNAAGLKVGISYEYQFFSPID